MITTNTDGQALSSKYGPAVRSDSRQFKARLKMNNTELSCDIKRMEFTKGSCSAQEFIPGTIVGSSMTAEVTHLTENVKNKRITAEIGLLTDKANDTWEWVKMGEYLVTEVKKDAYTTRIVAHGRLITETGGDFEEPTVEKTIVRLRTALSAKIGANVEAEAGINNNLVITESLKGITVYQAMQVIASCIGGYFCDTEYGTVRLCRYKTGVNTTFTSDLMLTPPELEEQNFTITGVRCVTKDASQDDDGEIPAEGFESGSPVNLIFKNPFMTQELFDASMERLLNYSYRPGRVVFALGDPRIVSTDAITFKDNTTGETYFMPCHRITHTFDGGFTTEIEAVKGTKIDNKIGSLTPIQQKLAEMGSGIISAQSNAKKAKKIASDTAQYFWFTETGDDTGAHITEIPKEQFLQDPVNGGGNLLARSNGIAVRDGMAELATFSAGEARIGQEASSHTTVKDNEFRLDKGTENFFRIYDLSGETSIKTKTVIAGEQNWIDLAAKIKSVISLTIDGTSTTYKDINGSIITLNDSPGDGSIADIEWIPAEAVPAMVFGKAKSGNKYVGVRSFASGTECVASGPNAHAEGQETTASGDESHAEGYETTASGGACHAEGSHTTASYAGSHAEGNYTDATARAAHAEGFGTSASFEAAHAEGYETEASKQAAHAEGRETVASGKYSHAEGYKCSAEGESSHAGGENSHATAYNAFAHGYRCNADENEQVVFGKCNESTTAAFVIGNGASSSYRSNGLELDWSGNMTIAGRLTQSSDKRLKEHISYLDDDAEEFIRALKPAHYTKDGESHVGFYAQDVKEADKWDCMTGEMNGYMTLSYTEIIAPLIRYCQRLEKRVEELEKNGKGNN